MRLISDSASDYAKQNGGKTYAYRTEDKSIKVNDVVMVPLPNGDPKPAIVAGVDMRILVDSSVVRVSNKKEKMKNDKIARTEVC